MFRGVSHLLMRVNHFAACREVYVGKLGLKEVACGVDADGSQICVLAVGASALELHEDRTIRPALDAATGKPLNSMMTRTVWISHIAFHVRDAHAVYHRLRESGIPWKAPPENQPLGLHLIRRRLLEFDDPDLFTIQLSEPIDEEGRSAEPEAAGGPWPLCDKLDHIALRATDIAAKREFYKERLGLREFLHKSTRLGEECTFMVGETAVELLWTPETHPPLQGGTAQCIAFSTDDIAQTYRVLKERGVEVSTPVEQSPLPGIRRCVIAFRDPDGLPVQVVQAI